MTLCMSNKVGTTYSYSFNKHTKVHHLHWLQDIHKPRQNFCPYHLPKRQSSIENRSKTRLAVIREKNKQITRCIVRLYSCSLIRSWTRFVSFSITNSSYRSVRKHHAIVHGANATNEIVLVKTCYLAGFIYIVLAIAKAQLALNAILIVARHATKTIIFALIVQATTLKLIQGRVRKMHCYSS